MKLHMVKWWMLRYACVLMLIFESNGSFDSDSCAGIMWAVFFLSFHFTGWLHDCNPQYMKGSAIPELIINPVRGWLSSHCSCDSTQTFMQLDLEKPQRRRFWKNQLYQMSAGWTILKQLRLLDHPKYLTICWFRAMEAMAHSVRWFSVFSFEN